MSRFFLSPYVYLFLSRFCKKKCLVSRFRFCQQIPSADFCRQQIFFLSADSISKIFVLSRFLFVSKCLGRRHLNDAHAGIVRFAPACFLKEKFSPSAGAHFRFYNDSVRFAGPSSHSIIACRNFRFSASCPVDCHGFSARRFVCHNFCFIFNTRTFYTFLRDGFYCSHGIACRIVPCNFHGHHVSYYTLLHHQANSIVTSTFSFFLASVHQPHLVIMVGELTRAFV
jgi:hypothetical protein